MPRLLARTCVLCWVSFSSERQAPTAFVVAQPYYITSSDDEPMAFAGLWESWNPPPDVGDPVETYSIITITPNEMMATLQDRMPVILDPADFAAWLEPTNQDIAALLYLLKPYPAELMKCHPVSTRVNSPKFDDPSCIERVDVPPVS
jgi:putative SOS response-associated peptidase YedK